MISRNPANKATPTSKVRASSTARPISQAKPTPAPNPITSVKKPLAKPATKPAPTPSSIRVIPNPNSLATTAASTTKTFLKKSTEPKGASVNYAHKNKKKSMLDNTSFYMWEDILLFCADSLESLVYMARVCKLFYRAVFERPKILNFVASRFYQKELKENPAVAKAFQENKHDVDNIIEMIQNFEQLRVTKKTNYFVENYLKIFEYGHIKENVLNKLLERLQIQIDLSWNKKRPYYALLQENFPFKIKYNNNMSHIILRVEDIKKILICDLSVLDLVITIRSRYLRRSIEINYSIKKSDLYDESNRKSTKVFHYYALKNLLFVYFHEDVKVQYLVCQISLLEVLTSFYNKTKTKITKATKVKRVETLAGIGLYEYIRQQLDFEVHFCIKNHDKMKFYFVNTTTYPLEYTDEGANFRVAVNNSFLLKGAEFKLDDDLGINQVIKNFFLVDFVLKDKDNILIAYSGFMDMKEMEIVEVQRYIDNYMTYTDEHFTNYMFKFSCQSYNFMVTCTKDARRNDILVHEIFVDIKKSILAEL